MALSAQTPYGAKPATAPTAPTTAPASAPAAPQVNAGAAPANNGAGATPKPATGLPAVSTATAPKPPSFQGIDPSKQWSGSQLLNHLNTSFGQPLNDQQRTYAMQYLGYNDPTGAAMINGADVNRLLEHAAQLSGGQYAAYQAPNNPTDPQAPYPTSGPLQPQLIDAPEVTDAPEYVAPTYEQQSFRAPTYEEAQNDPGYRFARDQGLGAIQASAAARGMLGTGTTMRDLSRYNQDLASQQYQTVYNRAADTFDRNAGERRFGYGANVEGAQASYAPRLVTWNARRETGQRNAELNFDRAWQRETYGREDDWRRDRARESDWQYRDNQAETRRRFLAELGQA